MGIQTSGEITGIVKKIKDPADSHHALAPEEQNGRTQAQIVAVEVISTMDEGRPGEHLHAALDARRERHAAGALQRGLADHGRVRRAGARSNRLRAVAGAVRQRRAL